MINSIVRGARILDLFRNHRSLSLKEIGELSGLHKTTAHGIVLTLLQERYLSQNKRNRRYALGPALFELGGLYRQRIDAYGVCLPFMRELSQKIGLTVQLSILSGRDVLYLSRVVTSEFLGFSSADGVKVGAHCTSSGKAMLSLLRDEEFDALFDQEDLPPRTKYSIKTRAKLKKELQKIRERGYALDYQEAELGLAGLAAAFRAEHPMAISVPCAAAAVDQGKTNCIIQPLMDTRKEIARQLGVIV